MIPAKRTPRALHPVFAALLLILSLAARAAALDHVVDNFRPDWSGAAADAEKMDPSFGDTLKIVPREFRYTAFPPVTLSDSVGNNGMAGGTPLLASPADKVFKAAFISWPAGHAYRSALLEDAQPRANLVVRRAVIDGGRVEVQPVGTRIAGLENIPDGWGGTQKPNRPPSYFHYVAEGDRYAACWGSMDPGTYLRRTTQKEAALGGLPETWGRYVMVGPGDPVNIMGYGQHGACIIPGTGGTRMVTVYERRIQSGNHQTEVRWDNLEAGTHDTVLLTKATFFWGDDHAVAADSAGNVVLIWRENADLYAAAYDAARTLILPRTLVEAGISYRIGTTDHWYRPYGIANVVNGRFLVAYTQGGSAYYRTLSVPWGAVGAAIGPETSLSRAGEVCNFPSIAVNGDRVLFGWFKQRPPVDSLVGALFTRQGGDVDPATRRDMPLTSETIAFNLSGPGWTQHHYFKAPSLALDSSGSIAVGYDNQFWAKMAITVNSAVYWDSGSFTSKSIAPSALATALPLDPLSDSIEYVGKRIVTNPPQGDGTAYPMNLSLSRDGSFVDSGSGFQSFPVGLRTRPTAFKYRLSVFATGPDRITQTKIDSLILRYNVKPRRPTLDSIRIGSAPLAAFDPGVDYTILRRRDSVRLVLRGEELDDRPSNRFLLYLGDRAVDSVAAVRTAPGRFRAAFAFLPPDSLPDPLEISVRLQDSAGWAGEPVSFRPRFRNGPPTATLSVIKRRGADVADIFDPKAGPEDTVAAAASSLLMLQVGDSAIARFRLGDPNDDTVTFRLSRNGVPAPSRRVAVADLLTLRFAADTSSPLVDTLDAEVADADTSITFRFLARPNRLPSVDSLAFTSYRGRDSVLQQGPFGKVQDLASGPGLELPFGLPAVLRVHASDRDAPFGDGARVAWTVLARPNDCAPGNLACHLVAASGSGDSIVRAFALPEERLVLRAVDSTGAFVERTVRLEYPVLDTAGSASFQAGIRALAGELDFILGGEKTARTVKAEITSTGNAPLRILSVSTRADDRKWLDLKLEWDVPGSTPPRTDSLRLTGRTDSNTVPADAPILLAQGGTLGLTFRIHTDSLRGDSVLVDTLLLRTNDFANPMLRIPIRMGYNDLPVLRISHLGGGPGPGGGYNDDGLPRLLPVRSALVFGFSEVVRVSDPAAQIQVYSLLDSLVHRNGIQPIPGTWEKRRRASPAGKRGLESVATGRAATDSLADTLVFRPAYDRPSDSLKVKPAPGFFIHRDVLRIRVRNSVTDRAGNALDLRLDKAALAPGSLDTTFTARVDTGSFRVVSTVPIAGEGSWDPDSPIRIRFNRALAVPPPRGNDTGTATTLDPTRLRGDSTRAFWILSTARGTRRYDLQFLALEDGDSTLVFRTRPKLAAHDTATVILGSGLADITGVALDGNGDGFPSGFYNSADTTDQYRFTFSTIAQPYYVFPNPFRFSDPRHAEKGAITFKNINTLPGFLPGREVVLRVHTMTGDLIYNDRSSGRSRVENSNWTTLDWDVRNNAGRPVGTGVYLYTLTFGENRVLRKGKVAIIR